jgi:hypothetical protein
MHMKTQQRGPSLHCLKRCVVVLCYSAATSTTAVHVGSCMMTPLLLISPFLVALVLG